MKLPPFNYDQQQWDGYKEFHCFLGNRNFVQFTTGELICTDNYHTRSGWGHSHNSRGELRDMELTTFQMNDRPEFLRDSRKALWDPEVQDFVKRTWMPQATPLLYDHGCNRIIGLSWMGRYDKDGRTKRIPSRFESRVTAYWSGPGRVPVGGAPVYYKRLRLWSKEERAVVREKVAIVRAKVRIGAAEQRPYYVIGKEEFKHILHTPVSEMSNDSLYRIAERGVTAGYEVMTTEYLEVRNV